jgi:Zn-dependent protease
VDGGILKMPSMAWFFPILNGLFLGLVAATLHEIGHLLVARIVGVNVKTIGFTWRGMYMVREAGPPAKNLAISFGGPGMNLFLLAFWHLSPAFGLANLCFAFCNLLPIQNSDGDRAWSCWRALKKEKALRGVQKPIAQSGIAPVHPVVSLVSHSPQIGD